jgi:Spy/CpxP family protein refolding chaperone
MKKTLLTALVIAASVCTAIAQDHKTTTSSDAPVVKEADQKAAQAKKAQEWQELLKTELKLTEEQQTKIAELNKAFSERRQAIHNNTTLNDEAKTEKKMALKKAWDTQFLQILTPEQQVRYKELVEAKGK